MRIASRSPRTITSRRTAIHLQLKLNSTRTFAMTSRKLAGDDNPVHRAADNVGQAKGTDPKNPSVLSSAGAIGRQFNPDGNIGQIGEKVGGPFSKEGMIGSQFDASKGGIAGTVEKMVDGPSNPANKDTKMSQGAKEASQFMKNK